MAFPFLFMQSTEKKTEIRLRGIGVSPGISHAPIRFAGTDSFEEPERRALDGAQVDFERERLQRAVTRTREQIREMQREADLEPDEAERLAAEAVALARS